MDPSAAYIMNAKIGFGLPWGVAYVMGVLACAAYVGAAVWYGRKREAAKALA